MATGFISKQLNVDNMTCGGCEAKIERTLKSIPGVHNAKASYTRGSVIVDYYADTVSLPQIIQRINALGYKTDAPRSASSPCSASAKPSFAHIAVIAILILLVLSLASRLGILDTFSYFPQAAEGMSYAAVFTIGLLTSVHCVGMCGGITISQSVAVKEEKSRERLRPSLLYNLGRITSYTLIGGLVGALGKVVSLTGIFRGAAALIAGIFMIVMGLNMLNLFPQLRRFSIRLPKLFTANKKGRGPLYIGLLNGLMPCGPLQAMQLYALSTGDPLKGAFSMLLFALGTTPLLFGFGAASSLLSKRFTSKMMTVSAVLVIILGAGMLNTGISMSGFLSIGTQTRGAEGFEPIMVDGYQVAVIDVSARAYAPITVKKDIPVRFILQAGEKDLNGCNNRIIIPAYGIDLALSAGQNIVEFTPTQTGTVPYSCWMNMIKSSITVIE